MKKILSIIITLALTVSMLTVSAVQTSAASQETLTITCKGTALATVPVGSEFIFHVGVDSAGRTISAAQGKIVYHPSYVQIVECGPIKKDGSVDMNAYSFPQAIRNTNLISNYFDESGAVYYNFDKYYGGIGVYDDISAHYFKIRFKATAPGTAEIYHHFDLLASIENGTQYTKLITGNKPNTRLSPTPSFACTIEKAAGCIGDADGDGEISVMDATLIQRVTAGMNSEYSLVSADVNGDGEVNLRDALNLMRYKVGMKYEGSIGEWIFSSEQE